MRFVVRHITTASALDLIEGEFIEQRPRLCAFILGRHIVVRYVPVVTTMDDLDAALALSASK